jgi:hypothetical protein
MLFFIFLWERLVKGFVGKTSEEETAEETQA